MKSFILITLAALALLAAPQAKAWNYNTGDVLLVFRNGSQDVEYDIGSITNLLGHTNGYTTTITGWDPSLVTSTFGGFSGLDVALLATSGGTNWLTSAEPNYSAYNISSQAAQTLSSLIGGVGSKPLFPIAIPTAKTNAYSIDVSGQYKRSSYDFVVSGGQLNGIPQFGGVAQFTVEQSSPGFLDLWAIQSTTVYPNSPADSLIGTFYLATNGVLTFVAGPRASSVAAVNRAGTVSAVQFSTTVGNVYTVAYSSQLGGALSTWTPDPTTLIGNGHLNTLFHTNSSSVTTEFYNIRTR
jgi:hypothetical protein